MILFLIQLAEDDQNLYTTTASRLLAARDPLVRILAWTLLSNYFHLLLEEIRDNGISKFMQRLVAVCLWHLTRNILKKGVCVQEFMQEPNGRY